MISFIISSSAVWLLLSLAYIVLLRNNANFSFNRMFLLLSIFVGVLIPLLPAIPHLQIESLSSVATGFEVQLPEIVFGNDTVLSKTAHPFDYKTLFIVIYLVGVTFFSIRFVLSIVAILRHYHRGNKIFHNNYTVIITDNNVIAFSFFKWIFIDRDKYESDEWQHIFNHEIIHVEKKHSFDNILLELLKIGLWFNPVLIIYSIFLRELHEFEADHNAIQYTNRKSYSKLLINQLQSRVQYNNIANYFINSLIKKRIIMMYKSKSNSKWQIYIAIPIVILLMTLVYSCQSSADSNSDKNAVGEKSLTTKKDTEQSQDDVKGVKKSVRESKDNIGQQKSKDGILTIAEEMPRFPGCEDKPTKEEKESCASMKLYKYIYKNLKYPKAAVEKGIEGKVFIRFVVRKTGKVSDVTILRDIGGGCGEAVKNALESMNSMPERWIPGKQGNENVDVYYTLPVVFQLDDKYKTTFISPWLFKLT